MARTVAPGRGGYGVRMSQRTPKDESDTAEEQAEDLMPPVGEPLDAEEDDGTGSAVGAG